MWEHHEMLTRLRRPARTLTLAAAALLLLPSTLASATAGGADTSFGDGGKTRSDLDSNNDQSWDLVQQADGRFLAVGFSDQGDFDFAVVRTTAGGQPDPSFSGDGKITIDLAGADDRAFGATVQSDGKIVLVGESGAGAGRRMSIVRLEADGDLDPTFSTDGKLVLPQHQTGSADGARDVVIQSGGRIVVAGSSTVGGKTSFALAGLEPDGDFDPGFGEAGKVTADLGVSSDDSIDELTLGAADVIVAAGSSNDEFGVARFESDGDLDTTFGGGDGLVVTDVGLDATGNGVGIQPVTGRIIVTGRANGYSSGKDYVTVGYESDGDLDTTFGGGDGIVTTSLGSGGDLACAIVFAADGSIFVSGDTWQGSTDYDFGLVRYTPDGVLDTSFGMNGQVTTDFGGGRDLTYGLAITPSGQLVQGGYSSYGGDYDITLIRYDGVDVPANPDGEVMVAATTLRGDGIYNLDAHQQLVSAKSKPGTRLSYEAVFTNDGTDPDEFTIEGTPSNARFKVTYRVGATDVTADVTGAGLNTGALSAGGGSVELTAKVKLTAKAKKGNLRTFLLTAISDADAGRGDAVGFTAKAS